jgi:thymidylate kinase
MVSLPLIVEFVGSPGAGKSTICRELMQLLPAGQAISSLDDRRLDGRAWGGVRSLLPKDLFETGTLLCGMNLAVGTRRHIKTNLKIALLLASAERRFRNALGHSSAKVVVLDQWVLQFVWSICAFADDVAEDKVRNLVRRFLGTSKRLVVFIDVDPVIAKERIASRVSHGSRFDYLEGSAAEYWIGRSKKVFDLIMREVEAGGSTTLALSGAAAPTESALRVAALIDSHMSAIGDSSELNSFEIRGGC